MLHSRFRVLVADNAPPHPPRGLATPSTGNTNTQVHIQEPSEVPPGSNERAVSVTGSVDNVQSAVGLIAEQVACQTESVHIKPNAPHLPADPAAPKPARRSTHMPHVALHQTHPRPSQFLPALSATSLGVEVLSSMASCATLVPRSESPMPVALDAALGALVSDPCSSPALTRLCVRHGPWCWPSCKRYFQLLLLLLLL